MTQATSHLNKWAGTAPFFRTFLLNEELLWEAVFIAFEIVYAAFLSIGRGKPMCMVHISHSVWVSVGSWLVELHWLWIKSYWIAPSKALFRWNVHANWKSINYLYQEQVVPRSVPDANTYHFMWIGNAWIFHMHIAFIHANLKADFSGLCLACRKAVCTWKLYVFPSSCEKASGHIGCIVGAMCSQYVWSMPMMPGEDVNVSTFVVNYSLPGLQIVVCSFCKPGFQTRVKV